MTKWDVFLRHSVYCITKQTKQYQTRQYKIITDDNAVNRQHSVSAYSTLSPSNTTREEVVLCQPGFIVQEESRGRTSSMQRITDMETCP